MCREARKAVLELDVMGARFTKESGKFHLTREGGHSARRIVHKDDLTGKEVEQALLERAENTKGITFFPHHLAVDLVQDLVRLSSVHVSVSRGGGMLYASTKYARLSWAMPYPISLRTCTHAYRAYARACACRTQAFASFEWGHMWLCAEAAFG